MAVTEQDIADLVQACNAVVDSVEQKAQELNSAATSLIAALDGKVSGSLLSQDIFVDAVNGDDANAGTSAQPIKTLGKAIEKTSSLFGSNFIYLRGDYTYVIDSKYSPPANTNIAIVGKDASTAAEIRAGATENRPKIALQIPGVSPGSGPIDGSDTSIRVGIYPRNGLKISFLRVIYEGPQGYENDTEKSLYYWGPRLIMWQDNLFSVEVMFDGCKIDLGLGGVMCSFGANKTHLGLRDTDVYYDPDSANEMCRHIVQRNISTICSYSQNSCNFYNRNTGLAVDWTQAREMIFNFHVFGGSEDSAPSLGVESYYQFTRTTMGMV